MKVLILGGTRLSGVHAVRRLIKDGHDVTTATRGLMADDFKDTVSRKIIDRRDPSSLKAAFKNEHYDSVIDNICFSSNDVKNLLDNLKTDRYVMTSSVSVYTDLHLNLKEAEVDTTKLKLVWCEYTDFSYDEIKRQAENALFQCYPALPSVAVRFPWIFGTDDYTKRLHYYIDHIKNEQPLNIDNLDEPLGFISSLDAGNFLAWCACDTDLTGAVNAGSQDTISLREIIAYTEQKSGKRAVFDTSAAPAPLNGSEGFSLDLSKATNKGYRFESLSDWLYKTIDTWLKN